MDDQLQLPDNFEALRELILERRQALPKRIAQVAAYALDNPDEIAFGTAASIASSAGVQPSTLIRFAQHLGYDGFTSLQAVFRGRLRERVSSYDDRLNALRSGEDGSQVRRIVEGFATASSRSLETLLRNLNDVEVEAAVARLAKAETIYVVARRRTYPVASYLAYAFGKLKIRYQLVDSSAGLDPETLAFASRKDAAIVISFSPYAPATLDHARSLAEAGVPLVAITDSAFSPLAETADQWFEIAEADYSGFRSLAATMALAMGIAVAIAEARRGKRSGAPRIG
ncbi:MurR/RpiR family transcriptional regulator [Salmonella enterica subsp. enterica serovar Virchow]|nr:MurR/RpiR family transcriptional regulator [Salmonella enterica subsp. enterica serovar Virchow]EFG8199642.1 MurR/RpiR family transcriptional regulator [Escherichia coli]